MWICDFCDGWTMDDDDDDVSMIETNSTTIALFVTDQGSRLPLVATRKNGQRAEETKSHDEDIFIVLILCCCSDPEISDT